ncbi:kinase-like domain-containing protein [Mycena metata]|uniref:Kinase-like domain-containing protein n=1 Tax=Mycena metata TaxID=1033252 RepID=A0AAD7IKE3_9AGAR|nr:kinase-like domain-containing protein [Mycena metata]
MLPTHAAGGLLFFSALERTCSWMSDVMLPMKTNTPMKAPGFRQPLRSKTVGCDHLEYTTLVYDEPGWMRCQPFLEERGYILRPRYRPGWVPEMLTPGKLPQECEDAIFSKGPVLDATRISDGAQVVLKIVRTGSMEVHISELLARHPGAKKHAVTVLEIIPVPDDIKWSFLVMPRMPTEQTVQGLVFLHSQNIAHRDICPNNIVVDASPMIPSGFHFVKENTSDGVHPLRVFNPDDPNTPSIKTRTEAGPLNYYLIDFGLSTWYPTFETRALVTGYFGQRAKRIPELSRTIPYDAFKVDMRLVGEMLRKDFLHRYSGLDFVIPLTRRLLRDSPARRPDAAKALAQFQRLMGQMSDEQLNQPIQRSSRRQTRKVSLFVRGFALT